MRMVSNACAGCNGGWPRVRKGPVEAGRRS